MVSGGDFPSNQSNESVIASQTYEWCHKLCNILSCSFHDRQQALSHGLGSAKLLQPWSFDTEAVHLGQTSMFGESI